MPVFWCVYAISSYLVLDSYCGFPQFRSLYRTAVVGVILLAGFTTIVVPSRFVLLYTCCGIVLGLIAGRYDSIAALHGWSQPVQATVLYIAPAVILGAFLQFAFRTPVRRQADDETELSLSH